MADCLILIRHGEVEEPYQKRYIGRTDPGLSAAGREACKYLQDLRCDLVIASPLRRAVETARLINASCRTDARLAEIDFGDWEMLTFDEIAASAAPEVIQKWFADPASMKFPNGGVTAEFHQQVDDCLAEIMALPFSQIAVVTHGGVLMRMISQLRRRPVNEQFDSLIGRGESVIWQKIEGEWHEE